MRDSRRLVVVLSDHALFRDGVSTILRDHGFSVHDGAANRNRAEAVVVDLDHTREETGALIRRVRRQHDQARIVAVGGALRLAAAQDERPDAEVETPRADAAALIKALTAARPPRLSADATRARRLWSDTTPRQREVMRWLAGGLDNSAIASELGVGLRAVKAHISSLLALFGCDNRTQLALYAQRSGLRARGA